MPPKSSLKNDKKGLVTGNPCMRLSITKLNIKLVNRPKIAYIIDAKTLESVFFKMFKYKFKPRHLLLICFKACAI